MGLFTGYADLAAGISDSIDGTAYSKKAAQDRETLKLKAQLEKDLIATRTQEALIDQANAKIAAIPQKTVIIASVIIVIVIMTVVYFIVKSRRK